MLLRFAVTGIVFGFFTEWLLGNGKIYDNIIKKTTMRRLSTFAFTQTPRRSKTTASESVSVTRNICSIARKWCDVCDTVMVYMMNRSISLRVDVGLQFVVEHQDDR